MLLLYSLPAGLASLGIISLFTTTTILTIIGVIRTQRSDRIMYDRICYRTYNTLLSSFFFVFCTNCLVPNFVQLSSCLTDNDRIEELNCAIHICVLKKTNNQYVVNSFTILCLAH